MRVFSRISSPGGLYLMALVQELTITCCKPEAVARHLDQFRGIASHGYAFLLGKEGYLLGGRGDKHG